jgi:hypothetical protein
MFPEIQPLTFMLRVLQDRFATLRENKEAGDIVQTVIIVGLMAAAAIIIVGIIVNKATTSANNIQMGGS